MILIKGNPNESKLLLEMLSRKNPEVLFLTTPENVKPFIDYNISVLSENFDYDNIKRVIKENKIDKIVDVYSSETDDLSRIIKKVADDLNKEYIRFESEYNPHYLNGCFYFKSQKQAAQFLDSQKGNILLTIPGRDCYSWKEIPAHRLYLLLPSFELKRRVLKLLDIAKDHCTTLNDKTLVDQLKNVIKKRDIHYLVLNCDHDLSTFSKKIQIAKEEGAVPIIIEHDRKSEDYKIYFDLHLLLNYLQPSNPN